MSKCSNCGAELPENGKFCTSCGTKVEQVAAAPVVEPAAEPVAEAAATETAATAVPVQEPVNSAYSMPAEPVAKEKKPVNKKLFIILGAALLALIMVIVVAVVIANIVKNKKEIEAKTIKFKEDYISVTFEGYNTMGTVKVEINREEFQKVAYKAMGYGKNSKSEKAAEEYLDLIYGIDFQVDKTNVSNGDEVTVKVVADEEVMDDVDVILKDAEFKVTVEGLVDVTLYDPFEDIKLNLSGFDGDVYFDWDYIGTESINDYSFSCDDRYNHSIGDTVTLKLDDYYVDYLLEYYNVMVTVTEKTYTIDKANKYITSIDEIDEDTLDSMKDDAEYEIDDEYDGYFYDCSIDSYDYIGMYMFDEIDGDDNYTYLIYEGTVSSDDDEFDPVTVYMAIRFTDLIDKIDGTQSYNSYPYFVYNTEDIEGTYDYIFGYLSERDLFEDIFAEHDEDDYTFELTDDLTDYSQYEEDVEDEVTDEESDEESEEFEEDSEEVEE